MLHENQSDHEITLLMNDIIGHTQTADANEGSNLIVANGEFSHQEEMVVSHQSFSSVLTGFAGCRPSENAKEPIESSTVHSRPSATEQTTFGKGVRKTVRNSQD